MRMWLKGRDALDYCVPFGIELGWVWPVLLVVMNCPDAYHDGNSLFYCETIIGNGFVTKAIKSGEEKLHFNVDLIFKADKESLQKS